MLNLSEDSSRNLWLQIKKAELLNIYLLNESGFSYNYEKKCYEQDIFSSIHMEEAVYTCHLSMHANLRLVN